MRRAAVGFCLLTGSSVLFPPAARGATLTVTTTSLTDTADGQCDLAEAIAAATTKQPVHGDCPAGDGIDEILLAEGATYAVDRTLRIVSGVQLRTSGALPATITAAGAWQDDPADPWSDCALFVSGDGASLTVADLTLSQGSSAAPLTGVCVTAGTVLVRRARVTGFARGGIVSVCAPDSGCDHDQLGQASTVAVYGSLIDLNHSPGNGGGLSSKGLGASLIVEHSSVVNNTADGDGGGVSYESGWNNQRIANSTLSGNSAANGGGISVHFAPATNTYLYLLNSTVVNNRAASAGGGIAFTGDGFTQDLNVYASIVTNNAAGTDEANVNGDWGSSRMSCTNASLIYVAPGRPTPNPLPGTPCRYDVADAQLGPLMPMGGKGNLPVHPLLPGSPAIDAALDDLTPDQERDDWIAAVDPPVQDDWTLFERVVDGDGDGVAARDLGAFELNIRWQTELLAVAATGPSPHTVVTAPTGFDRGAGTSYAATGADGEQVTYLLPVPQPGAYAVHVGVLRSASAGMFQLATGESPDGPWTDVGPVQDTYGPSDTFVELGPLVRAVFATAGQKYLRFRVVGKNEKSAGYALVFDYLYLSPSGTIGDGAAGGCGCLFGGEGSGPWPALIAALAAVLTATRARSRGAFAGQARRLATNTNIPASTITRPGEAVGNGGQRSRSGTVSSTSSWPRQRLR